MRYPRGDRRGPARSTIKVCLSLPEEMVDELDSEAVRLDRNQSWIAQQAWRIARGRIARLPDDDEG